MFKNHELSSRYNSCFQQRQVRLECKKEIKKITNKLEMNKICDNGKSLGSSVCGINSLFGCGALSEFDSMIFVSAVVHLGRWEEYAKVIYLIF